jgi:GDP-L-galactose phosphorylase
VEKAPTEMINLTGPAGVSANGVKVSKLVNYPVRGFVFTEGKTVNDLAELVSNACICLQENNIPFNVLISDHGRRIYLFPQVSDLSFIYIFSYVLDMLFLE